MSETKIYTQADLDFQKIGYLTKIKQLYSYGLAAFLILIAITPLTTSTIIFFILAFLSGYKWSLTKEQIVLLQNKLNGEETQ